MVPGDSVIRGLLGLGFWVQGFRCFPWLAVNFFLIDVLKVDPSTLQILQSSANLPMVAKPLYGLISDSLYISGQHRIPYIAFGAFLQAVSWLAIALLPSSNPSILSISLYLLLSNLGASIAEVGNDALVAEVGKQTASSSSKKSQSSSSGELQSFVWMASSAGGVLGNLIGGIAIAKFPPTTTFLLFSLIATVQFLVTICIPESSLNLPKKSPNTSLKKQLFQLFITLKKPEIGCSISWFAASYAAIPALTGTMFFYQTQHLKINSSILGISKVFGQASMLLWSVVYNRYLKTVPGRKLIAAVQATMAFLMVSDVLFVKGVYRDLGVRDWLYVITFSGLLEVLFFSKILPFNVLMMQLCPPGCEGSLMALVASSIALSLIVSSYFGVALASYAGVTGDDFSGFPGALLLQAVFTLVPIYFSSCVPNEKKLKTSAKKE